MHLTRPCTLLDVILKNPILIDNPDQQRESLTGENLS